MKKVKKTQIKKPHAIGLKKQIKKSKRKKAVKKSVKITKKIVKKKPKRKPKKVTKKKIIKRKPKKRLKKPIKKRTIKKRAKITKKTIKKKPIKKTRKIVRKKVKPRKKIIKKAKRIKKLSKKKVIKKKPKRKTAKKIKAAKKIKRYKPKPKRAKKIEKVSKKRRPKKSKKSNIRKHRYSTGSPLERLFESSAKVQIMKFFFRNPEESLLLKEIGKRLRSNLTKIKGEMKKLEKAGVLKTKQVSSRKKLFFVNSNFDFFNELRDLILKSAPVSKEKTLKEIRKLGKIKLVLLSGVFVGNNTARADLLIVGNNINQRKLNTFIKNVEAEAGTEINCVVMTTEEFNYRYDMYDRFVRDLLDGKNELLINKLGL